MTRFVLVNLWEGVTPNLSLGYVASYLEKYNGFTDIKVVEKELKDDTTDLLRKIKVLKPDLVGFTSFTENYYDINNLAKEIKTETGATILIGGPHITPIPQTLSKNFDIAILGEGEQTISELIDLFEREKNQFKIKDLMNVDGIAFHNNSKIAITKPRKVIDDIDSIPIPNRDIFDLDKYLKPRDVLTIHKDIRGGSMLTSRGCPYRCIFCQSSHKWSKVRMNSAEYVTDEILLLKEKYKVQGITVSDDLFIINKKRLYEIIKKMKEKGLLTELEFFVNGRVNLMNDEMMKILKKLNIRNIGLGLESGSDKILKYLKGSATFTVKQSKEAVKKINEYNINIFGFFMFGTPYETANEMRMTLDLMNDIGIHTTHASITTPFPGTGLWEYFKEEFNVNEFKVDWSMFKSDPVYEFKKFLYINKIVPRKQFIKIFKEAQQISSLKSIKYSEKLFSFNNFKKVLKNPTLAFDTFKRFIKKPNTLKKYDKKNKKFC